MDPTTPAAGRPPREVVVATVAAIGLSAVFAVLSPGAALWWTFIPAMGIAYGLHLVTTARRAPDPQRLLPPYLSALAWQFVHFAEEYSQGFARRWPEEIFEASAVPTDVFVWVNMLAYAAFALGALAIHRGWRPLMLAVWFFVVMGVMGNAVSHVAYALVARDLAFPGTATSLLYWVLGPLLLLRLLQDPRTPTLERTRPRGSDHRATYA